MSNDQEDGIGRYYAQIAERRKAEQSVVCVLPKDFMERVSYIGNLLSQMTMDSKGIKDDQLRLVAGKLCQAVSYMLNSCSWRDGELHDFDYEELRRKLSVFRSSRE